MSVKLHSYLIGSKQCIQCVWHNVPSKMLRVFFDCSSCRSLHWCCCCPCAVCQGLAKRHIASTNMNHESSRSHLIISCMIEGVNLQSQAVTRGKISFVDLAGSERWARTASSGVLHHGFLWCCDLKQSHWERHGVQHKDMRLCLQMHQAGGIFGLPCLLWCEHLVLTMSAMATSML